MLTAVHDDTMTAVIAREEHCDFCQMSGTVTVALYDGKTTHGPWAYMCEDHFGECGVGLGLGLGQVLIVKTS
jgi:hypothetical protein